MLRTRSPLGLPEQAPWTSFDLHVLSVPPAFILSQDQTLQQKCARSDLTPKCSFEPERLSEERNMSFYSDCSLWKRAGKGPRVRCVLAVWPIVLIHPKMRSPKRLDRDDRPVSVFGATRDGDTEIDWADPSDTRECRQFCPHWHSVFSSVFKEPNWLGTHRDLGFCRGRGVGAVLFRRRLPTWSDYLSYDRREARTTWLRELFRRGGATSCLCATADSGRGARSAL